MEPSICDERQGTTSFKQRVEGITAGAWVFGTRKSLPQGSPVPRERDEESRVLCFGRSRPGTPSAKEFTTNTCQRSSQMRQSPSQLEYHGTIPEPHN